MQSIIFLIFIILCGLIHCPMATDDFSSLSSEELLRLMQTNLTLARKISKMKKDLRNKDLELARKDILIGQKEIVIGQKEIVIGHKDTKLAKKDIVIREKDTKLAKKDIVIREKDNELNNTRREAKAERKLRVFFQTLVDLREIVDELLEYGYPKWAATKREKKEFSERVWRLFFLNIEKPKVLALKIRLIDGGMSEDTFIKMVQYFLTKRNTADHGRLSMNDREKVYNEFVSRYADNDLEKKTLQAIVYTYHLPTDTKVEYSENALKTIKDGRKKYKFLRIPIGTESFTESHLEKVFSSFLEKVQEEAEVELDNPTAFFMNKPNRESFILFKNFDSAYKVWEYRKYFEDLLPKPDFVRISNEMSIINDTEIEKSIPKLTTVKVTLTKDVTQEEVKKKMMNFEPNFSQIRVTQTKTPPKTTELETGKNQPTPAVFLFYSSVEASFKAYQHCKNEFCKTPGVRVALIREIPTSGLSLIDEGKKPTSTTSTTTSTSILNLS